MVSEQVEGQKQHKPAEHGKNGKIAYSQVFVFFLNNKIIDFTFDYMINSTVKDDKKIVSDIMNSIQDGYMYYPNL